jgi:hypothetical protein
VAVHPEFIRTALQEIYPAGALSEEMTSAMPERAAPILR